MNSGQQLFEAGDVHRLAEAILDGLADQRMIGDLAGADQILGTGHLVREDRRDQVFGVHPRQGRRHLLAAAEARQRERHAGDPAPAGHEHRRVEQGLDQQGADRRRVQVMAHLIEIEAVCGGQ
jgi:hypothetical protein